MHDLWYAVHVEDVSINSCQNTGFVGMDVSTDDVAGVDVDHHVRIEIGAFTGPASLVMSQLYTCCGAVATSSGHTWLG